MLGHFPPNNSFPSPKSATNFDLHQEHPDLSISAHLPLFVTVGGLEFMSLLAPNPVRGFNECFFPRLFSLMSGLFDLSTLKVPGIGHTMRVCWTLPPKQNLHLKVNPLQV